MSTTREQTRDLNVNRFKSMLVRKIIPEFRIMKSNDYKNDIVVCPCDGRVSLVKGGFKCRVEAQDYPRVCVPYQGNLMKVVKKNGYIMMHFVNEYFIPKSIGEREYISVVYGHELNMSRAYPELMDVQPSSVLNFTIVLKSTNMDSIMLPNSKIGGKNMWFEQGEEIAVFGDCVGVVMVLFNRMVDYYDDIKKYGKMDIECYVKLNDNVGVIG